MGADETRKAQRQRGAKEKSLRLKIEQDLRLGRSLEGMNIKGALSYYREIVNLAKCLEPEPPELKKAIDRRKALEAKEVRADYLGPSTASRTAMIRLENSTPRSSWNRSG